MATKRKIIGYNYSKLVCLPKFWLEQNELKKGDMVEMKMDREGNLVLRGKNVNSN